MNENKIIREHIRVLIRETINKILLYESVDDYDDVIVDMPYEIFSKIKNKEKIGFDVIPKELYLKALREFMQYGTLMRFPFKYINEWKELTIKNIIKLDVLNSINGHSSYFPFEEFYEVFEIPEEKQDENWNAAFDYLNKKYKMDKYLPRFSNNQYVISDYGLNPLIKLAHELMGQTDPNEILLTLDRVMNVVHPRSDLAELFIQGGSESLEYISAAE